jgi:Fe-S cluster assembly protein SufD
MMALARNRTIEPVAEFAAAFERAAPRLGGGAALLPVRTAGLERFQLLGMPTTRVEEWKYTNAAGFANQPMELARPAEIGVEQLSPWLAGGPAARRLIFVNGQLVPSLSHVESLPAGATVRSLGRMLRETPERVADAMLELEDGRSFTALNTAFADNGAWIELAAGSIMDRPLQLVFVTLGRAAAAMAHPRCILRLGEKARLHLIETHVALGEGHGLTNLVTQMRLGAGAELRHDRLQVGTANTSLIGKLEAELGDAAIMRQTVATMGGALVRNESEIRIRGTGVECLLNGVFMPTGREHVDTLIRIHHEAPGSHSDQFYKGVVDGESHAVFQGKIIVHKEAQQTNAFQSNNNLLLSDDAELDTKPELEIYADDVKCSHGATSGDLDPQALFYLRSRGLDEGTARSILTYAFAAEVFERFGDTSLKDRARRIAFDRLPGGAALTGMLE